MFFNARSLKTVTFEPNSKLKRIYGNAFQNTSSLTSITIPASVTSIDFTAFRGGYLKTVTLYLSTFKSVNTYTKMLDPSSDGTVTSFYGSVVGNVTITVIEPNIISQLGNYYIWNKSPNTFTNEELWNELTSSGYRLLNSVPYNGATTFDGYNILSQIIGPINDYINNSMPSFQKKDNSILFFVGTYEYSYIYTNEGTGWQNGTVYSKNTGNILTGWPGDTETSDNQNTFYVVTR